MRVSDMCPDTLRALARELERRADWWRSAAANRTDPMATEYRVIVRECEGTAKAYRRRAGKAERAR